jgi:hypothetical protein
MAGFGLESVQHSTFPAKINDLEAFGGVFGRFRDGRVKPDQILSVPGSGARRKIFLELAFHTLEILGVTRGFLLLGNIRP